MAISLMLSDCLEVKQGDQHILSTDWIFPLVSDLPPYSPVTELLPFSLFEVTEPSVLLTLIAPGLLTVILKSFGAI